MEVDTKLFASKNGARDQNKSSSNNNNSNNEVVAHSYIASRGQREREEEIYEVLPPTIKVKVKDGKMKRKVEGKRRTYFGNSEC